jgi:hypothetical protein
MLQLQGFQHRGHLERDLGSDISERHQEKDQELLWQGYCCSL